MIHTFLKGKEDISKMDTIKIKINQWAKDFVHNFIVHPLMSFLPVKYANLLHDKNANWAFGLNRYDEIAIENKMRSV